MLDFIDVHYQAIKRVGKYLAVTVFAIGDLLLLSVLGAKMSHYQVAPAEPSSSFGINISAVKHNLGKAIVTTGKGISSLTGALGAAASNITTTTKNLASTGIGIVLDYRLSASPSPALTVASQTLSASSDAPISLASFIKPTDDTPVPVIKEETSAAALAKFNEQQRKHIEELIEQQAAANRRLNGTIVTSSTYNGGYPAKWDDIPQDSAFDSWGMYNRECVSYTAFKVSQTFGYMPYWGGVGNANEWLTDAENSGIPVGRVPKVHSVAVSTAGYFGHTAWVEKVSGNKIYVSQYNYELDGRYSEMWVDASYFSYIYFN